MAPVGASNATFSQAAAARTKTNSDGIAAVLVTAVTVKYNGCMDLGQGSRRDSGRERGYAMAALLVGLSVMAVLLTAAVPVWSQFTRREKEEELIWRGQQYARAIGLFQRKFANTFPPNVDVLVEQRFLRKKYKDPITNDDFQIIPATGGGPVQPIQAPAGSTPRPGTSGSNPFSQPPPLQQQQSLLQQRPSQQPSSIGSGGSAFQPAIGVQGVVSKSKDTSIKVLNGRTKYNEWLFVYLATSQRAGTNPNAPNQPVRPGDPRGSTFTPLGGSDRRPPISPGMGGQGSPPFGSPGPRPSGPAGPGGPGPFGQPRPPRS